jgi:hypothetical protein
LIGSPTDPMIRSVEQVELLRDVGAHFMNVRITVGAQ